MIRDKRDLVSGHTKGCIQYTYKIAVVAFDTTILPSAPEAFLATAMDVDDQDTSVDNGRPPDTAYSGSPAI